MLGLGGGAIAATLLHDAKVREIDVVEHSTEVIALFERDFRPLYEAMRLNMSQLAIRVGDATDPALDLAPYDAVLIAVPFCYQFFDSRCGNLLRRLEHANATVYINIWDMHRAQFRRAVEQRWQLGHFVLETVTNRCVAHIAARVRRVFDSTPHFDFVFQRLCQKSFPDDKTKLSYDGENAVAGMSDVDHVF